MLSLRLYINDVCCHDYDSVFALPYSWFFEVLKNSVNA